MGMCGVNVGKQLELLERNGHVIVDNLVDDEQLSDVRNSVGEIASSDGPCIGHEKRIAGLASRSASCAQLATHPLVLQLVRRVLSCAVRLSDIESCRTDADFVRKELEQ